MQEIAHDIEVDRSTIVSTIPPGGNRNDRQSSLSSRKRPDLSCAYCKRLFRKSEHLKRHENTHRRGTFFTCHVCQRKFGRQDSLKRHVKTHAEHAGHVRRTASSGRSSPLELDNAPTSSNLQQEAIENNESTADAVGMVLTNQQNSDIVSSDYLSQDLTAFPTHQTWPESLDLLELLINADAGWSMDPQLPLIDLSLTPDVNSNGSQEDFEGGSYARARQAMQHMSNLMQDLSFNLATEVEATGVTSNYLDDCLTTFFERFILIFPVVHQPTFSLKDCASPLLLNMIVLGSLFLSSKEAVDRGQILWRLAHAAVATSWQSMVDQANGANSAAGVQLVMTALLGQTHAVLSNSRSSRMTSHAFHGLGFYWARQCHMPVTQPFTDVPTSNCPAELKLHKWYTWAAQETRHRALLGHYILDGIISQYSGLPTSDRHVTNTMILPASTAAYEASSVDLWIRAMNEKPQSAITFCQVYVCLFATEKTLAFELSPFSIRVILEGLQSLISDNRQANSFFIGAQDPKAISGALWRLLDSHISSSLHSSEQRLDLLLRWHAICIELCMDSNLVVRQMCEVHSIQQDLYSKSPAFVNITAWATTLEARRAVLHASAILKLTMDLSLGRMQSIHVPFAIMSASIVFLALHSQGVTGATVPIVMDWGPVCFPHLLTVSDHDASIQVRSFLDLSRQVWNTTTNARGFCHNLHTLRAVLESLSNTWGIARDMQKVLKCLTESIV